MPFEEGSMARSRRQGVHIFVVCVPMIVISADLVQILNLGDFFCK